MTQILLDKGFVKSYLNVDDGKQGILRIYLKYQRGGKPVIQELKRISKPGLRRYSGSDKLPRVLNGLGIAIISTLAGRDDRQGSPPRRHRRRSARLRPLNPVWHWVFGARPLG